MAIPTTKKKVYTTLEFQGGATLHRAKLPELTTLELTNLTSKAEGELAYGGNDNLKLYDGSNWQDIHRTGVALSTGNQFTVSVATGTAPFAITSTTPVANLTVEALGNAVAITADANSHTVSTTATEHGIPVYGANGVLKVGTPVADDDASSKGYVDTAVQGLDHKASVRFTTTANITLSGLDPTGLDKDAVMASSSPVIPADIGDRILVKDQTVASQNGIYVVASGAWSRATDAALGSSLITGDNSTFTSGLGDWVDSSGTVAAVTHDASADKMNITGVSLGDRGKARLQATGLTVGKTYRFEFTATGSNNEAYRLDDAAFGGKSYSPLEEWGSSANPGDGTHVVEFVALTTNLFVELEEAGASTMVIDDVSLKEFDLGEGSFVFVEGGAVNANSSWVKPNATDWVQFSGAGQITAGDGLAKLGDVMSVDLAASTPLEFASNKLSMAAIDTGDLADNAVEPAQLLETGAFQMARLGIGVAAHATAGLEIKNDGTQHIRLVNGTEYGFINVDDAGDLDIWAHGSNKIQFKTGGGSGVNEAFITDNGVGIGADATSPSGTLHVSTARYGTELSPNVNFNSNITGWSSYGAGGLSHEIQTNGPPIVYSGAGSLKGTITQPSTPTAWYGVTAALTWRAGATYIISAKAYLAAGWDGGLLRITHGGSLAGSGVSFTTDLNSSTTGEWQDIETRVTVGTDTTGNLYIYSTANAGNGKIFYLDDISCKEDIFYNASGTTFGYADDLVINDKDQAGLTILGGTDARVHFGNSSNSSHTQIISSYDGYKDSKLEFQASDNGTANPVMTLYGITKSVKIEGGLGVGTNETTAGALTTTGAITAGGALTGTTGTFSGLITNTANSNGRISEWKANSAGFAVNVFQTSAAANKWAHGINSSNEYYVYNYAASEVALLFDTSSNATFIGDLTAGALTTGGILDHGGFPTVNSSTVQGLQDGACYDFDGTDGQITLDSIGAVSANASITLAAWIKADTSADMGLVAIGNVYLSVVISGGNLEARTYNSGAVLTDTNAHAITPGVWHHVVGVFSGGSVTLYRDGVGATAVACANQLVSSAASPPQVGRWDSNYMDGQIRDVKIFPSALTAPDVRKLYSGENPKKNLNVELIVVTDSATFTGGIGGWGNGTSGVISHNSTNKELEVDPTVGYDSSNSFTSFAERSWLYLPTAAPAVVAGKNYLLSFDAYSASGSPKLWVNMVNATGGKQNVTLTTAKTRYSLFFPDINADDYLLFAADEAIRWNLDNVSIQEVGTLVDFSPRSASSDTWHNAAIPALYNGDLEGGVTLSAGSTDHKVNGVLDVTGALILPGSGIVRNNTADAADTGHLQLCGGGAFGATRGATIDLAGNENGNAGLMQLHAGNGSVGGVRLYTGGTERLRITDALAHFKYALTVDGLATVARTMNNTTDPTSTIMLVLQNKQDTDNTYNTLMFKDAQGNDGAGIAARHTDHANNKAELGFWTRDGGNCLERFRIDSDGTVNVNSTLSTGRNVAKEVGTIHAYSSQYSTRVSANVINGGKNYNESGDAQDWLTTGGNRVNAYVVIDLHGNYTVDRAVIYNQNENSDSRREVKGFKLQGSSDASTWVTVLDSEMGQSNGHEPNPGWSFRIPANWSDDSEGATYRYWKFIMETFHGDDPYGGITEIELYEASDTHEGEVTTSSLVAGDIYTETAHTAFLNVGRPFLGDARDNNILAVSGGIRGEADSYTKLLIHSDRSVNGDTDFWDSSPSGHAITRNGNAYHRNSTAKFGGTSMYFDGTGDYLTVPASSDFDMGAGDFTVDFWFYTAVATRQWFFAASSDYHYSLDFSALSSSKKIGMWASSNGTSWNLIHSDGGGNGIGTEVLSLNTWYHIAMVRNGNNWRTYINGVVDIDVTVAGTITDTSGEAIKIGRHGSATNLDLEGYLDEFRVSKGIARWTSDFTPPSCPYSTVNAGVDSSGESNGFFNVFEDIAATGIGTGKLRIGEPSTNTHGSIRLSSFANNEYWDLDPGTNTLNFKDWDGTAALSLNGTTNNTKVHGKLGVGGDPGTKQLEVFQAADDGGLKIFGHDDVAARFSELSVNSAGYTVLNSSTDRGLVLKGHAIDFYINSGGTHQGRWTYGGDLGVGTIAPAADLHVRSGVASTDSTFLLTRSTSDDYGIKLTANHSAGNVYIDSIGNSDGPSMHFRMKTLGTAVNALSIKADGTQDHQANRIVNSQTVNDLNRTAEPSLYFDGDNDYVDIGNFGVMDAGTVSMWYKLKSLNTSTYNMLFSFAGSGVEFSSLSGGAFKFYVGNDPLTLTGDANTTASTLDKWVHLVCAWEQGTNGKKIFINGVLANQEDCTTSLTAGTAYIGARWENYEFNGEIKDVRIHNRALDSDEVAAAYNGEPTPFKYADAGPTDGVAHGVTMPHAMWRGYNYYYALATNYAISGSTITITTSDSQWPGAAKRFSISGAGKKYRITAKYTRNNGLARNGFFLAKNGMIIRNFDATSGLIANNGGSYHPSNAYGSNDGGSTDGLHYTNDTASSSLVTLDYILDLSNVSTSTLDCNEIIFYLGSESGTSSPYISFDETTVIVEELGEVAAYTPQSINADNKWADTTSNANHGAISGATLTNQEYLGEVRALGLIRASDGVSNSSFAQLQVRDGGYGFSASGGELFHWGSSVGHRFNTNSKTPLKVLGTGAVTATSGSSTNLIQVARVHNQTITGGNSSANFTILHNLGTTSITVSVREQTSREHVECAVSTLDGNGSNSANHCRISFATAPDTDVKYDVTVIG